MFTFHLDSTGPKISFPANQPVVTKNNPTFRWTSSEPAKFKCALDSDQFNERDCGDGTSSHWTGTNIPDGHYKLLVYGTDDMNNKGPTAEHKFIVGKSIRMSQSQSDFDIASYRTNFTEIRPTLH